MAASGLSVYGSFRPIADIAEHWHISDVRKVLNNPYVQIALTIGILVCFVEVGRIVNLLSSVGDTRLIGEWAFVLIFLTVLPFLTVQSLRTGVTQSTMGRVTREHEPVIFWIMVALYGLFILVGLALLLQLIFVGP